MVVLTMKQLRQFITEKFKINSKNIESKYNYHPKDRSELADLVYDLIRERGPEADLNDIDVSKVDDMHELFHSNFYVKQFNGDISKWNVSNVKNMKMMFQNSAFTGENGDLSKWNVSNVENMNCMFRECSFNGDISKWNVGNVKDIGSMFSGNKKFNGDISEWDTHNVEEMSFMFSNSNFTGNIDNWDVSKVDRRYPGGFYGMFNDYLKKNQPKWYKK